MLSFRLHRTATGEPLSVPIDATGRCNLSMTSVGSGSHQLSLAGTKLTPEQWHTATTHWWISLAVCWDNWPIYAGPIRTKRWNPRTKLLNVSTVTVDALFRDRYAFGVGAYDEGDFEVVAKSHRAALAQIIRKVSTEGPSPSPYHSLALPFLFSHEGEAGAFTKMWEAKDWATSADIIAFIQKQDGGPDLAFPPVYDERGWLRYDVRAGNPRIDGNTIDLPLSVKNNAVPSFEFVEEGAGMVTGMFVPGEGRGDDRPFGEAGDFDDFGDIPAERPLMTIRDASQPMPATLDKVELKSAALAKLKRDRFPTDQLELTLKGKTRETTLGTRLRASYSGDEYKLPSETTEYVVALSHSTDQADTIRPEVQRL